jgi:Fe-S cluster biogenesis protein NfuA
LCTFAKNQTKQISIGSGIMSTANKRITVYTESTPNPEAIKFVADVMLSEGALEFLSPSQAKDAPLVRDLLGFPFVQSVFVSKNYITVRKNDTLNWDEIITQLREFITDALNSETPFFTKPIASIGAEVLEKVTDAHPSRNFGEIEQKIISILEEYIQPAVESDGGAIALKSFADGVVTVSMKGSCSGCPSSTLTLKAGIEALLKRMVPEVETVVAES